MNTNLPSFKGLLLPDAGPDLPFDKAADMMRRRIKQETDERIRLRWKRAGLLRRLALAFFPGAM